MQKGDKVKIESISTKRYLKLLEIGMTATVVDVRNDIASNYRVAIEVPGISNPGSSKGLFWFMQKELKVIKNIKENNMEKAKFCIVKDFNKNITDVAIYFGKVEIGQMVVCNYYYGNGKLSVRRVVDVINDGRVTPSQYELSDEFTTVIGTVDDSAYKKHCEDYNRKCELERQMKCLAKAVENKMYFKFLSENDEEFAKLYKEYEDLTNA